MPAEGYEIRDALQKMRVYDRDVYIEIDVYQCKILPELSECRLESPTIDELNFLAKRLAGMPEEQQIIYRAVVNSNVDIDGLVSMKDLINSTYGLDGVMVASNIYNDEQLGQFVIEGDLDDEVNALPDQAIPLLDRRKIPLRLADAGSTRGR